MSTIHSLMNSATNAMGVHSAYMQVTSRNVANANTPSYSRQRMAMSPDLLSTGQTTGSTYSMRSTALERSILGAQQGLGYQEGRYEVLSLAEPGLNDLDGTGVSDAIDTFFESVSALTGNPSGSSERQQLLNAGRSLAYSLNLASQSLEAAQDAAQEQAEASVETVNSIATQIADINSRIHQLKGTGQPIGELVDQRDALLGELSAEVDVQVLAQDDGSVVVMLGTGQPIVDDLRAHELVLSGGGDQPLGLRVLRADGSVATVPDPSGGRLGGVFTARDETLEGALRDLDAVAFALATEVNAVHESGFDLQGGSEHKFFAELTTIDGSAKNIQLSSDVDGHPERIAAATDSTLLPGDDSNILALLDVRDAAVVPGGRTLLEGYDAIAMGLANEISDAAAQVESQQTRLDQYETARASYSGVSIQEEMTLMTVSQRAFEAVSRVVNTANELYDTVLQMV